MWTKITDSQRWTEVWPPGLSSTATAPCTAPMTTGEISLAVKKRHWVKSEKLDGTSYMKQLYNQPVSYIHWPVEWYVDNQCLYLLGMTAPSLRRAQESDCPCSTGFTFVFVKIIHFNTTSEPLLNITLFNSTSDQALLSGGAWRISWRNTGSILLFGLMSTRNLLFCF